MQETSTTTKAVEKNDWLFPGVTIGERAVVNAPKNRTKSQKFVQRLRLIYRDRAARVTTS